MNKIYKSVWSDSKGTFVAVSENTKTKGKSSVTRGGDVCDKTDSRHGLSFTLKRNFSLLLSVFSLGVASNALAQVNSITATDPNVIVNSNDVGAYTIGVKSNPNFNGTVTAGGFSTGGAISAGSINTNNAITAGSVSSNGTISAGNFEATTGTVTAKNVTASGLVNAQTVNTTNVIASGLVSTPTVNATNLNTKNLTASNLVDAKTVNATTANIKDVSATNVTATGDITGGNFKTTNGNFTTTIGNVSAKNVNARDVTATNVIASSLVNAPTVI